MASGVFEADNSQLYVVKLTDVLVLLFILLVPIALLFRYYKRVGHKAKVHVALVGPCNSGKTSLLLRMCKRDNVETVTSQTTNETTVVINGQSFVVVDYPGNQRLGYSPHPDAKAVVCLVDSGDKTSIKNGASIILNLLCDAQVLKSKPKLLVVANKSDVPNAKSAQLVEQLLLVELERAAESIIASAQLQSTHAKCPNMTNATFEKLPLETKLVQVSVRRGQIDPIFDFISKACGK